MCQEPPILEVILGGRWRFLTGVLEDGVIFDVLAHWYHGSSLYSILYLCAKFQLSSIIRSVSRTPHPWSHTWRTLKVPDWRLGGWGHPWRHGSSWYVILDLCTKFQLSSMFRSASRTPPSSKSYLEEFDGSWLEIWRMGSSLMLWMVLICDSWLVYQISAL